MGRRYSEMYKSLEANQQSKEVGKDDRVNRGNDEMLAGHKPRTSGEICPPEGLAQSTPGCSRCSSCPPEGRIFRQISRPCRPLSGRSLVDNQSHATPHMSGGRNSSPSASSGDFIFQGSDDDAAADARWKNAYPDAAVSCTSLRRVEVPKWYRFTATASQAVCCLDESMGCVADVRCCAGHFNRTWRRFI